MKTVLKKVIEIFKAKLASMGIGFINTLEIPKGQVMGIAKEETEIPKHARLGSLLSDYVVNRSNKVKKEK